jgi:subfamily B ATP-binding cassette protein MsbA
MLVVAACTAFFAHLVMPLVDDVLTDTDSTLLFALPAIIIGLYLLKGAAEYTQNVLMEYVGQDVVASLQRDLYRHVIYQDLGFFQQHTTAGLSARFLFDLHRLRAAFSQAITGSMRDVTMIMGLTINLFDKDWKLALVSLTVFPLVIIPIVKLGKRMRKYSAGTQEAAGALSHMLTETFAYNRQVKTYTMEEREIARSEQNIGDVFRLMMKAARVRALSSPLVEVIAAISLSIVIVYAGLQVRAGELTAGAFMSFLVTLLLIYRPLKGLSNINTVLQDGLAAAERTFALIDTPTTVTDSGTRELTVADGAISFEKVSFAYADGTEALSPTTLEIRPGETVAVVGPSGAGKSTLLNLIPRFFDPASGRITIDGQDIRTVTLNSLRRHIALVTQEVALFNDTIYNNIAYGNPTATREQIIAAAKDAAAHGFISKLEHGYDTPVSEAGSNLSGGQRQRIAIARALLKDAPILLLDEATSALDTQSEREVQKALDRLMKGRTTLVVAHRLSTVVGADRILVMQHGHIVESGTHAQLLKHDGVYAGLYKLQSEG